MTKTDSLPVQYRTGTIEHVRADGEDGGGRMARLSFSSEAAVDQWWGREILGHGSGEVRLDRLNSGRAPLLLDHQLSVRDGQIGVVVSARVEGGRGVAEVRFGKSELADQILDRVRDGELSSVSVGYRIYRRRLEEETEDMNVYRVTDWEPLEVSIVAVPADNSVGVGRSNPATNRVVTERSSAMSNDAETKSEAEGRSAEGGAQGRGKAPAAARATAPTPEEAAAAERARVREITAIGRQCSMDDKVVDKAVEDGTAVTKFQRMALDHMSSAEGEEVRGRDAKLGMSERELDGYSIVRAMNYLANPRDQRAISAAGLEIEASRAAEERYRSSASGLIIPPDVLLRESFAAGRRDQEVGSATAGGNLVAQDLRAGSFIEILRSRMALSQLGATVLSGLQGNVDIPRQTGSGSVAWVAEKGAATESEMAFDLVQLTPNTLCGEMVATRRALQQMTPDVENLMRRDLIALMVRAIDRTGIQGSADPDAPDGLLDWSTNVVDIADAAAPTWAEVVQCETEVAIDDADMGSLAYGASAGMVGTLKSTRKDAGSGIFLMGESMELNGYGLTRSNHFPANELHFGNWADFIIGMWSGIDLMVDPYTQGSRGSLVVRAFQEVDFASRHDQSFTRGYVATP